MFVFWHWVDLTLLNKKKSHLEVAIIIVVTE